MRVSISMATYNGGAFLAEQLQSFIDQIRQPDELVICDDGSTDDTLAVARAFAEAAPFPVVIERNPRNLGYSANFSKAASLCTGDVIFLSDQDDRWFEPKIERSLDRIAKGAQVVLNDQQILFADGSFGGTILGNMRSLGFADITFVAGCCTAMTRPFAKLALPFASDIPFDDWLSVLADLLDLRDLIDEPLQTYRRHDSNTSQSIFAGRDPTVFDLVRKHGLDDPRSGWMKDIAILQAYADRIYERRDIAEGLAGKDRVEAAFAKIERRQGQIRRRLEVLALPRWKRSAPVLLLWQSGFYDQFAGWKSAIKDLVRP